VHREPDEDAHAVTSNRLLYHILLDNLRQQSTSVFLTLSLHYNIRHFVPASFLSIPLCSQLIATLEFRAGIPFAGMTNSKEKLGWSEDGFNFLLATRVIVDVMLGEERARTALVKNPSSSCASRMDFWRFLETSLMPWKSGSVPNPLPFRSPKTDPASAVVRQIQFD